MGFGRKDDTWGIGWGWELAGRAAASTKNPRTLQWMPSWTCDNRLLPSRIKQTAKGYLRGNTDMDIQMPTPTNASVVVWEFLQWKLENDAAEAPWAPTAQIYFITLSAEGKKWVVELSVLMGKFHTGRFTQGWQCYDLHPSLIPTQSLQTKTVACFP